MLTRSASFSPTRTVLYGSLLLFAVASLVVSFATLGAFARMRLFHSHHRPPTMVVHVRAPAAATADRASIVDIASNVTDVLPLIHLAEGEHVLAVDDQPVENDLVAGTLIQRYRRGQFSFVDVTTNQRRILVLQH